MHAPTCLRGQNGILGGVLAAESFTLSQAYLLGGVDGREPPEVWLVDGRYLDACNELDAAAIGKSGPKQSTSNKESAVRSDAGAAFDVRLDPHEPTDVEELRSALAYVPNDGNYWHWLSILMGIHHATAGSDHGRALAHGWSAGYPSYTRTEVDAKWDSFNANADGGVTVATVFLEARENGWREVTPDSFDDLSDEPATGWELSPGMEIAGLPVLTPAQCATLPPRDYIVKHLISLGQEGCLFGAPVFLGRSAVCSEVGTRGFEGRRDIRTSDQAAPALYVACEDQAGMADRFAALHAELGDAPDLFLFTTISDLYSPGEKKGTGSADFEALRRAVKKVRPGLVIIDTLAMAMPGLEENDPAGMNRVVQIGKALAKGGAAVMFIHHGTKSEGDTPRGHSVFNGALDFSILLKGADTSGIVRAKLPKNRNGRPDLDIAFRTGVRRIGVDVDGDPRDAPIANR